VAAAVLAPAAGIRWRPALDELVLLDVTTGHSWLLDPAGAAIWQAVLATGSVAAALDRLSGADPREVEDFVDGLVAAGTLVAGRPGG